jgi:hypothetical protein
MTSHEKVDNYGMSSKRLRSEEDGSSHARLKYGDAIVRAGLCP